MQVLPLLIEQYFNKTEPTAKKNTLLILSRFLSCCGNYKELKNSNGVIEINQEKYWKTLEDSLQDQKNESVKEAGINAFILSLHVLSHDQITIAANLIVNSLNNTTTNSMKNAIIMAFIKLNDCNIEAVKEVVLPKFQRIEVELSGSCTQD